MLSYSLEENLWVSFPKDDSYNNLTFALSVTRKIEDHYAVLYFSHYDWSRENSVQIRFYKNSVAEVNLVSWKSYPFKDFMEDEKLASFRGDLEIAKKNADDKYEKRMKEVRKNIPSIITLSESFERKGCSDENIHNLLLAKTHKDKALKELQKSHPESMDEINLLFSELEQKEKLKVKERKTS